MSHESGNDLAGFSAGSTREGFAYKTLQIFGKIHSLVVLKTVAACFFKGNKRMETLETVF